MEETSKGIRIIRSLKRIGITIKQNMDTQYKELNITAPQGMLIGVLFKDGKTKITELSDKLGLSNSTVSGIIDRLEKHSIVERIRSKEDRRVVYVNLTDNFKEEAKNHYRGIEGKLEKIITTATSEELDRILDGLATLEKLLNIGDCDNTSCQHSNNSIT